jgi:pimeloyl-ACP methyl ester carboxylesterase
MTAPRLERITGPTGPLNIRIWDGSGAPVVLVHPINTAGTVWTGVAERLPGPVVVPDLRGHGGSGMDGPYTVDGYVDDVLAVMDGAGVTAAHLAGGSLGGTIGLALAARCPDRALSVTPIGSTLGSGASDADIQAMIDELEAKGTARYFADLAPLIVGTEWRTDERVLGGLRSAAGARPESVVGGILWGAFGADIRELTARVKAPVHSVGGTEDPTCPPAMTEEIAAATGGRVTILDGVGHLPMLEIPERLAELILDSIRGNA